MFNSSIRSQQTNEERGSENDGLTQNSALFFNGNVMIYHDISLDSKGTQFSDKATISLLKTCRIPQDFSPDFSRLAPWGAMQFQFEVDTSPQL
jgi:hypothetical protein